MRINSLTCFDIYDLSTSLFSILYLDEIRGVLGKGKYKVVVVSLTLIIHLHIMAD